MATFDRADLTTRLQRALARPTTDQELDQTLADALLGDAQMEVALRLCMQAPETNYGAALPLTSADNKLYQTSSASIEWIGEIEVYRDSTLKGPPLRGGAFWDCRNDYAVEGTRGIRLSCGRSKAFAPFVRFFQKPLQLIDASNAPSLQPLELRQAVVQLAAALFCNRGGKRDPTPFVLDYERIYNQVIASLRPNQSTGVGPTGRWWDATGDLGRISS